DAAGRGGTFSTGEMYQHAIATLALIEALVDLEDETLEPIVRETVQLILRAQNTEHKPETLGGPIQTDNRHYGGWRYGPGSADSDLSVTGWQVLALKAAVNAGFSVPEYVFPAAAGFVRSLQGKNDGSFRYNSPGDSGSSCARAGMGALSLQLCGNPQEPMIPPAIRFMQDHAPRWNVEEPGDGYPFYYWYYGTRVMYLAGGDDWRIWKDWMCRFLVDHQNEDGSWDGAQNEERLGVYRVALGALMLEFCCGHVPIYMSPVKRLGSGTVKVEFEEGAEKEAGKYVEIIMDASNSMWGQIAGEAKITIARKALTQIINGLPETMNVGLRVYGHRYGLNDPKACTDTELLVPIGPLEKAPLVDTVNKIQIKGKTPLVHSVLEAIKDFAKIPNGSVILVTDGIESCNGDIMSIAPAIKAAGLELKVHIVGFDIKERESREQLEAIAKSTEGRYLDAKNAGELLSALQQTLQVEYVVLNEKGEVAGRGIVGGEEVKLKEGTYTLRVLLSPRPLETKIAVKPDGRSVWVLKKEAGTWKLGG
ncbi:MAG: VWA domain-containing protein, partial [Candidatus Aminicenantes bacterium]|nr:VWA domain-containing protein [Candidatus Aminicenantes bacterium]